MVRLNHRPSIGSIDPTPFHLNKHEGVASWNFHGNHLSCIMHQSQSCVFPTSHNSHLNANRTKSTERISNDTLKISDKIFIKPPCEECVASVPPDEINDACAKASLCLTNPGYRSLHRRQLVAIEHVLDLQGTNGLHVSQLEPWSNLMKSLSDRMKDPNSAGALNNFARCMDKLLEVTKTDFVMNSISQMERFSKDLITLYEVIGSVLHEFPVRLCGTIVELSRIRVTEVAILVSQGSSSQYVASLTVAFSSQTFNAALVHALSRVQDEARIDLEIALLELVSLIQSQFPDARRPQFHAGILHQLCRSLAAHNETPNSIVTDRGLMHLLSGSLLQIAKLQDDPEILPSLQEAFAEEVIIRVIQTSLQHYCVAVNESDRMIRNSLAMTLCLLFNMAATSLHLAYNLMDNSVIEWCLHAATRPELSNQRDDLKTLRIQTHELDSTLKQTLIQSVAHILRIRKPALTFPREMIVSSFIYYLKPFEHPQRKFWSSGDYLNHTLSVLEAFSSALPVIQDEWIRCKGHEKIFQLLRAIISKTESTHDAKTELKMIKGIVDGLLALVTDERITSHTKAVYFSDEALLLVLKTADALLSVFLLVNQEASLGILNNVLTCLTSYRKSLSVAKHAVDESFIGVILNIMDALTNVGESEQRNLVEVTLSATTTLLGQDAANEKLFLDANGAEKLSSALLYLSPNRLAKLLPMLSELFRTCRQLTAYIRYSTGEALCSRISKLGNDAEFRKYVFFIVEETMKTPDMSLNDDHLRQFVQRSIEDLFARKIAEDKCGSAYIKEALRKFILVLEMGDKELLSVEVGEYYWKMGKYVQYLKPAATRVYESLFGELSTQPGVYQQGKHTPVTIASARSDALFKPSDESM